MRFSRLLTRRHAARLLTGLACLFMAFAAYFFTPSPKGEWLIYTPGLMGLGSICLFFAMHLSRQPLAVSGQSSTVSHQQKNGAQSKLSIRNIVLCLLLILGGLICLAILIENNGQFLHIPALMTLSLHTQFAVCIISIMALTLGFGLIQRSKTHSEPKSQYSVLSTQYFYPVLLIIITILAFVLRLWELGTAVHKFVDEVHFSTAVMSLLPGTPGFRLLEPFSSITAFPWLYPYWQSLAVQALGRGLEALRLPSVILGTLGIPAIYLLAKNLFDRPIALLAALLLATFPPHLHFSRIGLNNIADPLVGTLMLAFLGRGLRTGRRLDFALAGAALGLTQYFYEGGRLLYPPLAVLWLIYALVTRRRSHQPSAFSFQPIEVSTRNAKRGTVSSVPKTAYASYLIFFLVAFLVALPIYTTLIAWDHPLVARFNTVGLGGSYWLKVQAVGQPQTLEQSLLRPFLVYVHQPETGQYYGGEQALVLTPLVPFLLLGVVVLVWRWRSPGFVLLIWLMLTSAGNILMTESAISARYVVAFPALVIIIAVGVRTVLILLLPTRYPNWARALLLGSIGMFFGVAQVIYYFGPHLETYNRQIRPFYDNEDAMFRAAALPSGTQVHVFSDYASTDAYLSGVLGFLADGFTVSARALNTIDSTYLSGLPPTLNHAFFLEPDDGATLALLQTQFTLEGPFASPYNVAPEKQLLLYFARAVPAG